MSAVGRAYNDVCQGLINRCNTVNSLLYMYVVCFIAVHVCLNVLRCFRSFTNETCRLDQTQQPVTLVAANLTSRKEIKLQTMQAQQKRTCIPVLTIS